MSNPPGDAAPAPTRGAEPRRRRHWSEDLPPATAGAILRERLYGNIACLSTLLVLAQHTTGDATAVTALLDVAIATGGLFGASLFAEFVAHLGTHGERLHRRDWRILLGTSWQVVQAAAAPMLLLTVAAAGWWDFHTALWTSIWVLVAQMGLFALLAVRRTGISRLRQILLIAAIIAFGVAVIAVKTITH